jgi:hypothetical protein
LRIGIGGMGDDADVGVIPFVTAAGVGEVAEEHGM